MPFQEATLACMGMIQVGSNRIVSLLYSSYRFIHPNETNKHNIVNINVLLIGSPAAVEQCVFELERRGFCDSYAWSPPIPVPENASFIQSHPGEVVRLYKRWYPRHQCMPL